MRTLGSPLRTLFLLLLAISLLAPAAASAKRSTTPQRAGTSLVAVGLPASIRGGVRLQVRVLRRLAEATVTVNGRRLATPLRLRAKQLTVVSLGTTAGVRFGRNRIVVQARGTGDRTQVVRRSVLVRRGAPLVGVTLPNRPRQGDAIRLDARATRASGHGRLRFRWRVVGAPRRAHARLVGATSARPRLLADHPGRYQLALTVTETGGRGGHARAAASGCAVAAAAGTTPGGPLMDLTTPSGQPIASTPLPLLAASSLETIRPSSTPRGQLPAGTLTPAPQVGNGCTTQSLPLELAPTSAPLGVAFDSRATVDGQTCVRVGESFYAIPANRAYVLFLDASTLEELGTSFVPSGADPQTWAMLTGAQYVAQHQVLAVITGPGSTIVQGIFDSPATAARNEGLTESNGSGSIGQPGEMTGWLQQTVPLLAGGAKVYRFVSPDRVSIETSGSATARSNTIALGGASYPGSLPSNANAGFEVLVTDAALRPVLGTPAVFGTNTGDPGADAQQQSALAGLLQRANAISGSTVVVQSIGHPRPTTAWSVNVGQQLERLGGSEWMFLGLDGSGGYALIGNPAPSDRSSGAEPAAEASSQWTAHGGDSLAGLLKRRPDGALRATLADSVGGANYGLEQVAFQPPTPWPQTDTPGKRAAGTYIAAQLGVPTQGPALCSSTPQPDLHAEYCNGAAIAGLAQKLGNVTYPSGGTRAFTAADFAAVKTELSNELGDVENVWNMIGDLQTPFSLANESTAIAADGIATTVMGSIPVERTSQVSANLSLAASLLYGAAEVPEVGEAFGPIAAALDIASELTSDDGVPSPDWAIQAKANEVGGEVDQHLMTAYFALGSYGDILVSDYGKLSTAGGDVLGTWGVSTTTVAQQYANLRLGVKQWLYTAIVPAAYDLVRIPGIAPAQAAQTFCIYSRAPRAHYPWKNAAPSTTFFPLNMFASGAPRAAQMMAMLHGSYKDKQSSAIAQSGTLADELFGSPAYNHAGLVAPWFYDHASWTVQRPKMLQPSSPDVPGYCGVGGFSSSRVEASTRP
ncbi:MAG: hypothetical protein JWQ48_3041 [Conexibacter sp.]|nr:hypothetical protein [Conexibacter sp.]